MEPHVARDELRKLLGSIAVKRGNFVLSSGRRSSYYLDARLVTLSAAGAHLVATVFLQAFLGKGIEAVAGLTVGADPIVAAVTTLAGISGDGIDGIIVRKEGKAHGAGGRLVGPWRDGLRVAIVDDTFTTGASALTAAGAILDAGGSVEGIYALIDREEGARRHIEGQGYAFHSVYSAREILESAP